MNRRQLLRVLGGTVVTGFGAMAGCTTLSRQSSTWNCGPGDDELADVADDPESYDDQNLSIAGDIIDLHPGDGDSLMIHDSTAETEVFPGELFEYPKDQISTGNCMEGSATVMLDRTEDRGHLCLYDNGMVIETYETG